MLAISQEKSSFVYLSCGKEAKQWFDKFSQKKSGRGKTLMLFSRKEVKHIIEENNGKKTLWISSGDIRMIKIFKEFAAANDEIDCIFIDDSKILEDNTISFDDYVAILDKFGISKYFEYNLGYPCIQSPFLACVTEDVAIDVFYEDSHQLPNKNIQTALCHLQQFKDC